MSQYQILIADDEPDYLETMIEITERAEWNYKILQAVNGKKALEIAQKKNPNLIITDWDMPEMDGLALVREIQKDEELKDIPVIICSGVMTTSENLQTALEAGAVDYIRKPIDEVEFRARVQSMIKLSDSYQKVKDINAYKDKILSVVTHDLRGAVGGVYSVVQLLQDGLQLSQQEFEELLKEAETNIGNSYTLLENLLTWARNQIGSKQKNTQAIPVKTLVDQATEVLTTSVKEKGIQLIKECNSSNQVLVDERMIVSVLQNLIGNAIKFTPKGGTVKVLCKKVAQQMQIQVQDSGVGISDEAKGKILQEGFYTTMDTEQNKGSGLGLQIAREFLQKHNSELHIESSEEEGSIFSFRLPVA